VTPTPQPPPGGDPDDQDRMLSPEDVAGMLGGDINARSVRDHRHQWGLKSYKIGRHVRFTFTDVHAWIAARQDPSKNHDHD
jgi:excisionase family DNA binding protein